MLPAVYQQLGTTINNQYAVVDDNDTRCILTSQIHLMMMIIAAS